MFENRPILEKMTLKREAYVFVSLLLGSFIVSSDFPKWKDVAA